MSNLGFRVRNWLSRVIYGLIRDRFDAIWDFLDLYIHNHMDTYHSDWDEGTEPEPEIEYFEPKREPWPDTLAGYGIGYIVVSEETPLWYAAEDDVLLPYENEEWASNTLGRRIQVKEGRALAVYPHGDDWHYGMPRPYTFDGGTLAYRIMDEQIVDGKKLWNFAHPILYVPLTKVGEAWMP